MCQILKLSDHGRLDNVTSAFTTDLSKHGGSSLLEVAGQGVVSLSALAVEHIVIGQVVLALRVAEGLLSSQQAVVGLSNDSLRGRIVLESRLQCTLLADCCMVQATALAAALAMVLSQQLPPALEALWTIYSDCAL